MILTAVGAGRSPSPGRLGHRQLRATMRLPPSSKAASGGPEHPPVAGPRPGCPGASNGSRAVGLDDQGPAAGVGGIGRHGGDRQAAGGGRRPATWAAQRAMVLAVSGSGRRRPLGQVQAEVVADGHAEIGTDQQGRPARRGPSPRRPPPASGRSGRPPVRRSRRSPARTAGTRCGAGVGQVGSGQVRRPRPIQPRRAGRRRPATASRSSIPPAAGTSKAGRHRLQRSGDVERR